MKPYIYILGLNYIDVRNFAYERGYHYSDTINVDREDKLRGYWGIALYVTPRAKERKNYDHLIQMARIRKYTIIYIHEQGEDYGMRYSYIH